MKAQLVFNLDNEEDKEKLAAIVLEEGTKLKSAMWKFAHDVLRKYRKYELNLDEIEGLERKQGHEHSETSLMVARLVVEHIDKKFYEALNEYEAKID